MSSLHTDCVLYRHCIPRGVRKSRNLLLISISTITVIITSTSQTDEDQDIQNNNFVIYFIWL